MRSVRELHDDDDGGDGDEGYDLYGFMGTFSLEFKWISYGRNNVDDLLEGFCTRNGWWSHKITLSSYTFNTKQLVNILASLNDIQLLVKKNTNFLC